MTVCLSYIAGESVKTAFMNAVVGMLIQDQDLIGSVRARPGAVLIARARNLTVEEFLTTTTDDWLWMVDADMEVNLSVLRALLQKGEEHGACVVAAQSLRLVGNEARPTLVGDMDDLHYAGTGCMLVHRDVLKNMMADRYGDPWIWFGHDLVDGERLGEDFTFCRRVREYGFKIYGLEDVIVPHHKSHALERKV